MTDETGEAIDARAAYVRWARGELGEQDPNRYYALCAPSFVGHVHDKSWCGIFALAGLHTIGLCSWAWGVGKNDVGFVWRLRVVQLPEPGDIAVFRINPHTGATVWHHAIVERAEGGWVYTIDGNAMTAPKEGVEARQHPIDSNVTFYSIASLMRDP